MVKEVKSKGKQIGVVSNYFEKVSVVAIKLEKGLKIGDVIKIIGGDGEVEQVVDSMQINGKVVEKAKKGDDVGIRIDGKARRGYRVFKI